MIYFRMLRIYIGFQAIKFNCFLPPPPPPHLYCFPSTTTTTTTFLLFRSPHIYSFPLPPPSPPSPPHFYSFPPPPLPHFYCLPSAITTTTFSLFPLHHISILVLHHHHHRRHRHHICIVFYPSPTRLIFFPPRDSIKDCQLPFCSNASCSEQQSWFSSAVSRLPCSSAPVSFKESYSTTTTYTSPSLIQYTCATHFYPEENKWILLSYKDAYKTNKKSFYKRLVVLLKTY